VRDISLPLPNGVGRHSGRASGSTEVNKLARDAALLRFPPRRAQMISGAGRRRALRFTEITDSFWRSKAAPKVDRPHATLARPSPDIVFSTVANSCYDANHWASEENGIRSK
jgi:hypothetical protein